jgi:hypothetical protein
MKSSLPVSRAQHEQFHFQTFRDGNERNEHLNGEIAKALFARTKGLGFETYDIAKPEISCGKNWTRLKSFCVDNCIFFAPRELCIYLFAASQLGSTMPWVRSESSHSHHAFPSKILLSLVDLR